jgi:putative tricarboxylic transport membrane protein
MESIYCIVWLAVSLFVFLSSFHLGVGSMHNPGAGFMLFWSSICLAILAFILLVMSLAKNNNKTVNEANLWQGLKWQNNATVVVALIIYCLALPLLGYLLSTFGLMIILFHIGKLKPWVTILSSLLTILLSYYLFDYLLQAPLPRGILGL